MGVMTLTPTAPAPPGGVKTLRCASSLITSPMPGLAPKLTPVAPVNPLPLTVTYVPPPRTPEDGLTAVTLGALGSPNVNLSPLPALDVPSGVVTVTSTVPAVPAGLATVSWVSLCTSSPEPGLPAPKLTAVAPVKPPPITVTGVPPAVVPTAGLTAVTCGPAGPAAPLDGK